MATTHAVRGGREGGSGLRDMGGRLTPRLAASGSDLTAGGGTRVSAGGRRGARLTRRVREEYRVYFDRNATMSGAKRRGSAGMDRRSNAVWVLPQAVSSLW